MQATGPSLIRTLVAHFSLPLRPHQLNRWRGAFVEMGSREYDLLHNHRAEGGLHYRYPLIQYRITRGKAAIFAIGAGTQAIQQVLSSQDWTLRWNDAPFSLALEQLTMGEHPLLPSDTMRWYRLMDYVALNQANYERWRELDSYVPRVQLLEDILTGHILGFVEAMGQRLPEQSLEVRLVNVRSCRTVKVRNTPQMAFNLLFRANVQLPPGIGLGKSVSLGYGQLWPVRRGE
ncbi:MAG: CRISPR-associated endonuclease Cas6 [Bacteroidota bacterium]